MQLNEITGCLSAFVNDEFGTAAKLLSVEESDGHAGLTYLFEISDGRGVRRPYVLKIPPAGVKLKGNTDVMRQAPLLNALHDANLPVPACALRHCRKCVVRSAFYRHGTFTWARVLRMGTAS